MARHPQRNPISGIGCLKCMQQKQSIGLLGYTVKPAHPERCDVIAIKLLGSSLTGATMAVNMLPRPFHSVLIVSRQM